MFTIVINCIVSNYRLFSLYVKIITGLACICFVRAAGYLPGLFAIKLSQLPHKSAPLLVRAAFGGRRHRLSSHLRSIFHWSICFVLFCISQSHCMYLFLCFPSCLCGILFVYRVMFDAPDWCSYIPCFVTRYVYLFEHNYCDCLRVLHFCLLAVGWRSGVRLLVSPASIKCVTTLCSPAPDSTNTHTPDR